MVTPNFDAMTDDEFVQWLRDNQPVIEQSDPS